MRITVLISFLFFLLSCQRENSDGITPAVSYSNLSYGTHARHVMDIHLPAGRDTNTASIILIHGGAWMEGSKADLDIYLPEFKSRLPDYALFNINYRLAGNGQNIFPAQEEDVAAAVEHIYENREEYQISKKFVLLGVSAGGHLALLQGYKHPSPVKPRAIISFFGPTELTQLYNQSALAALFLPQAVGGTPSTHATAYYEGSPLNYLSADAPPTLFLQGGADPLVPPSQSELLKTRLEQLSVPHEYIFYPGEAHGWEGAKLQDSFDRIAEFIKERV